MGSSSPFQATLRSTWRRQQNLAFGIPIGMLYRVAMYVHLDAADIIRRTLMYSIYY
jgi:hypothetical protein